MKILAWLLFGTSCALFTLCFCKQQLEAPPPDNYAAENETKQNWNLITSAPDEPIEAPKPATRPTAVANTDLGDATN
jgi:hypothetical protein